MNAYEQQTIKKKEVGSPNFNDFYNHDDAFRMNVDWLTKLKIQYRIDTVTEYSRPLVGSFCHSAEWRKTDYC